MAVAFFDIAHPRGEPRVVEKQVAVMSPQEEADRRRRIEAETEKFLSQMDKNGDGAIVRDEAPEAFRRFGFRDIDHNGDDRLERSEIEAEAARRQ